MSFDIGNAIGKTFRIYIKAFAVLFLVSLVVNAIVNFMTESLTTDADLGQLLIGLLLTLVASMLASSLVTAVSTHAVAAFENDEALSIGQLLNRAAPAIGVVIGVSILMAIGVTIGLVLLIIPGLFAMVWWAASVPAAVIEGTGVIGAFGRSVQLVKGNAWNVFGYGFAMVLITVAGGAVLGFALDDTIRGLAGDIIGGAILSSIITPFGAVGYGVLYFELRKLESSEPLSGDTWEDSSI